MTKPLSIGVMTHFGRSPRETLALVRELGLSNAQIAYSTHRDNDEDIAQITAECQANAVEITTIFCGFEGESYADIPTVRATVGLVPENTRAQRVARVRDIGIFARKVGVSRVAAHIGFIPEDAADARYAPLVQSLQGVCDDAATREQTFALETGQETAKTLRRFIDDVSRPNLRVNCDPANMILYGNDNPIDALDLLAPFIDGVHCKDGLWPTEKGQLGREVPLGEGDVDVPRWIEKLLRGGYRGPLTIEREIHGDAQKTDILRAISLLESLVAGAV